MTLLAAFIDTVLWCIVGIAAIVALVAGVRLAMDEWRRRRAWRGVRVQFPTSMTVTSASQVRKGDLLFISGGDPSKHVRVVDVDYATGDVQVEIVTFRVDGGQLHVDVVAEDPE